MTNEQLISIAMDAMKRAYCPYSEFRVGAALITKTGKVFTGCNIENASFGATVCAERTAIFKAVSEGFVNFQKIAIVSDSCDTTYPCGICLQVMNEFMPDGSIVLVDKFGSVIERRVSEFLPYAFSEVDNGKEK